MSAFTTSPVPTGAGTAVSRLGPEAFPVPNGREEEWRFTPLDRVRALLAGPAADGTVEVAWSAPDGVQVTRVAAADPRVGSVLTPPDRLAALALERADRPLVVQVPAGAEFAEPVTVTVTGRGGTSYGHLVVDVERGAAARVVIDHRGGGTFAANVEYRVGDGASLTVVSVQDWDREAVHVGVHAARLGRDARFRSTVVTLGGHLVRLAPTVSFAGPGGDAQLDGVFLTSAGQHHEHRLQVDHEQPDCRSRVVYKGALQGTGAHSVWIGDVLIGPRARGTDSYEQNRNLVLSPGARADSVPNLEIATGDVVGAGHASATGRFDDEQLFYLSSRGIPPGEARRLVVRGFFADVVERIDVPELRERLLARVDAELDRELLR
ncbi:MAG: Fe-S cluster assembly protein SufD [Mycobacteriales bacterium]